MTESETLMSFMTPDEKNVVDMLCRLSSFVSRCLIEQKSDLFNVRTTCDDPVVGKLIDDRMRLASEINERIRTTFAVVVDPASTAQGLAQAPSLEVLGFMADLVCSRSNEVLAPLLAKRAAVETIRKVAGRGK